MAETMGLRVLPAPKQSYLLRLSKCQRLPDFPLKELSATPLSTTPYLLTSRNFSSVRRSSERMTVYRGEGEGEGDHGTIMATPFSFCTSDVELADGEFVSSRSSRGGGPHQLIFSDDDAPCRRRHLGHSAADGQRLQLEQRAEALALQPEDGGGRLS